MIFNVFRENHRNAPANVRQEARKRNEALYSQACQLLAQSNLPDAETFAHRVSHAAPEHIRPILYSIAKELYQIEGFDAATIPPPPAIPESMEGARYRDQLIALISKLSGQTSIDTFEKAIKESFAVFATLPPIEPGPYSVPLTDLLANLGKMVERMIEPLKAPYFAAFREQYNKNACHTRSSRRSFSMKKQGTLSATLTPS
jgi:hypothetical protein